MKINSGTKTTKAIGLSTNSSQCLHALTYTENATYNIHTHVLLLVL